MRLRLRSIGSKETLKIATPNSCTLPQLRQILAQSLPNSPSPAAIRLSLNGKDELQSDGDDSLQSLGVAAGDLIFFSLEQAAEGMSLNSQPEQESRVSESSKRFNSHEIQEIVGSEGGETVEMVESEMEMEFDRGNDGNSVEIVGKSSFSVPGFLRKVFAEELSDDSGRGHKLIVIAIHAVMLESGFVGFDKNAKMVVNGFQFRNGWPSGLFRLSLCYTLPEGVRGGNGEATKTVVLKFQSLGSWINIYGALEDDSGKGETHVLQLNEDKLVPYLNVIWADCCDIEYMSGANGDSSFLSPEKEVFTFWRAVKDNLALPLLIDLCEEAGLELPPCFIRLPTDLKLKILESMTGVDLARVSCTCSELRYLGSNNDLWKLKFDEEFPNERNEEHKTWKMAYVSVWTKRKDAAMFRDQAVDRRLWPEIYDLPRRRPRNPFMIPRVPRIIGGDYDIGPPHGHGYPGFEDGSRTTLRPSRNFLPTCNLGSGGAGRFV